MFVLCLMKKTMVVSWWVGGEKSERLSKCWLKLWRWRCTWNDQTNTSYALGHLGNMDVLWELENVVICNMNYIFFFCWEPGWQKTLPNQQKPSFPWSAQCTSTPSGNSASGLNLSLDYIDYTRFVHKEPNKGNATLLMNVQLSDCTTSLSHTWIHNPTTVYSAVQK